MLRNSLLLLALTVITLCPITHAVIVDEVTDIGSLNLMLSGRVDLQVKGKIRDMAVHCTGLNEDNHIRVDELFVQPVVQEVQVKAG